MVNPIYYNSQCSYILDWFLSALSTYIHTHIIHLEIEIETFIEMKKPLKYLDELYINGVIKIALLKA